MKYKSYKLMVNGFAVAEVKYPAHLDNCWWFSIRVWSPENGFIKSAQHLDEDGVLFNLVEA